MNVQGGVRAQSTRFLGMGALVIRAFCDIASKVVVAEMLATAEVLSLVVEKRLSASAGYGLQLNIKLHLAHTPDVFHAASLASVQLGCRESEFFKLLH